MIAAKAPVEVRNHRQKLRSLLRRLKSTLEQPVSVDARAASYNERGTGNIRIAPSILGFFDVNLVHIAPNTTNGLDAFVMRITLSFARTDTTVNVGLRSASE